MLLTRIVDNVARTDGPRVLAGLIRLTGGDFDAAEEALQEAYARALVVWRRDGLPAQPGACPVGRDRGQLRGPSREFADGRTGLDREVVEGLADRGEDRLRGRAGGLSGVAGLLDGNMPRPATAMILNGSSRRSSLRRLLRVRPQPAREVDYDDVY